MHSCYRAQVTSKQSNFLVFHSSEAFVILLNDLIRFLDNETTFPLQNGEHLIIEQTIIVPESSESETPIFS